MSSSRQARILRLWNRDPCCHWCGRLTFLVFRPAPRKHKETPKLPFHEREATLDHLHTRLVGGRVHVTDGTEVTVLACWKCNADRNHAEQAQRPLEQLRGAARKRD